MIILTHEGDHWEFWIDDDKAQPKTGVRIGFGPSLVEAAENADKYLDAGKQRINDCIREFCQRRLTGPPKDNANH